MHKKINLTFLLAALVISVSAQTASVYKFYEKGKYGFKDRSGNIVLPAQFDHVSEFSEGLALVNTGGSGYDMEIDDSDVYNGTFKFIDTQGKVALELPATFIKVLPFSDGLAAVEDEGTFGGYINKTGKLVIPVVHEIAQSFHDGLAAVTKFIEDDIQYGYIDKKGELIIPFGLYQGGDNFSDSVVFVMKDEKTILLDTKGKVLVQDFQYDTEGAYSNGLIVVRKKEDYQGKHGYANKKGELAIDLQYSSAEPFSEGLALVSTWGYYNSTYYFINPKGERVITLAEGTDHLTRSFSEELAALHDKTLGFYYIDKTGKKAFDGYFDTHSNFKNGIAGVSQGSDSFTIDKTGKRVR